MIGKNTKPGTVVFHEALGFGKFIEETDLDFVHVMFEDGMHTVHRKRLTEIEEEPKP